MLILIIRFIDYYKEKILIDKETQRLIKSYQMIKIGNRINTHD